MLPGEKFGNGAGAQESLGRYGGFAYAFVDVYEEAPAAARAATERVPLEMCRFFAVAASN